MYKNRQAIICKSWFGERGKVFWRHWFEKVTCVLSTELQKICGHYSKNETSRVLILFLSGELCRCGKKCPLYLCIALDKSYRRLLFVTEPLAQAQAHQTTAEGGIALAEVRCKPKRSDCPALSRRVPFGSGMVLMKPLLLSCLRKSYLILTSRLLVLCSFSVSTIRRR